MRPFPPLLPDSFAIGQPCPACHQAFAEGDVTTIVPLGPGDDPEAQRRRDEGRPYNAVGTVVHWECSTQERDA